MNFAERLVQAAAKKSWETEKQRGENGECRGDAHDEMEMAGDEIVADGSSSGKIVAREENSGKSAREKKRNETEREKHGGVELDPRGPERAGPTGQEDRGRASRGKKPDRKDERRKTGQTPLKKV